MRCGFYYKGLLWACIGAILFFMAFGKEGLLASYSIVYPPTPNHPNGQRIRRHDSTRQTVVGVGFVEDLGKKGTMVNDTLVAPGKKSEPGPAGVYIESHGQVELDVTQLGYFTSKNG